MIVKTGANYQADGGYIEASREGNIITVGDGETTDKFTGRAPYAGLIALHIINHSSRDLGFTIFQNVPTIGEVLGNPGNTILAGTEETIEVPAYIGIKQRVRYSGTSTPNWSCDADPSKFTIEAKSDGYLTFTLHENITDGMSVNFYEV